MRRRIALPLGVERLEDITLLNSYFPQTVQDLATDIALVNKDTTGPDTITLAGTYTLNSGTSGPLALKNTVPLTIAGNGAGSTTIAPTARRRSSP